MRTYIKILTLFLACALIVSCSKEEKIAEPELTITGIEAQPVIEAAGGRFTLNITANKEWSASSGQGWCKVEPSKGTAGSSTVTIVADENTTTDERNAQIRFTCETVSQSITVTQKQKDALTVTSDKIEVDDEENTISVELKSNISFTYEVEASAKSWITPITTKALTKHVLQFKVSANEDFERREGKIFIKGGAFADTVYVYQEGSKPSIVISQNEYTVGSKGEEITVQLRSNVNYQIIMPQGADWVKEITTKAYSDYTHYFKIAPNDTYDSREAIIIFKEVEGSIADTVKISQMQKDAIIVANKEYKIGYSTTELKFKIATNLEVDVESSANWIKYVPPTRGLKDIELKFAIDTNNTNTKREGVITISKGNTKQQIKVIQMAKGMYTSTIIITHENVSYTIAKLIGSDVTGKIDWGDGKSEEYAPNAKHEYPFKKDYMVTLKCDNATEIVIPDLEGIKELGLTNF